MLDVLRALDAGEVPVIPWTRDSRHGLVHVDDVALACLRALDAEKSGLAVNVVGEPVTAEQVYTTLVRLHGGDPTTLVWHERRARYQAADRTRMQQVLGMSAGVPLEEGLRGFVDWYRSER
jgi:UDP-glucose 4-epimerase